MRTPLWTDFSRWTHEELIRALAAANPYVMRAAADTWAVIAAALHELAQDITPADADWTGPAADRHRRMTTELAGGTGTVAAAAAEVRDLMYAAAEALQRAWTTMPPVGGTAAHRQAVLVMAGLAERYLAIAGAMHTALGRLPADPAAPETDPVTGAPVTGREPLFGGLMPAGLAATAAAAAARSTPPAAGGPRPAGTASVPAARFGGGGGGGGVPGLSLPTAPSTSGLPSSPATAAVSTASAVAPGVAAATGGAAAGAARGAMPPMMPGAMMGGAPDGGGMGRRVPPWLVDTQDVWGETSVITSAVIGEDGVT
ncbi:hypothetical protein [Catenuloplanes atrovinosus]|uniref:PPE family domain-containing protein n=1 Tax=Catenuloplanes atrovinosus TaxID=137266 RepID=A0AAE3YN53_9ACTN|nr:hypothetical protein [Catenuloplanes atrovinosus]MDR7275560.1 hypothetical protein [Catenuloplanes atrovinosus]